jgi:hypothetical protein
MTSDLLHCAVSVRSNFLVRIWVVSFESRAKYDCSLQGRRPDILCMYAAAIMTAFRRQQRLE